MMPPARVWYAAAARVRLVVWGKACGRQVEPNPAEMAQRYGAEMSVLDLATASYNDEGFTKAIERFVLPNVG